MAAPRAPMAFAGVGHRGGNRLCPRPRCCPAACAQSGARPSPSKSFRRPQPLPSPSITGAYPRGFYPGSLHMVSPKVGWNGVAYVETSDAGLHWRVISSSPATIFNQINQIKGGLTSFVLDATHAWMTGPPTHGLVVIWPVDGGHT